jgi:hypothetical protein
MEQLRDPLLRADRHLWRVCAEPDCRTCTRSEHCTRHQGEAPEPVPVGRVEPLPRDRDVELPDLATIPGWGSADVEDVLAYADDEQQTNLQAFA